MKTFRIILLTTACVGLGLPASRADFVTVGTPNGGTRDPLFNPGTSRFQQVYSASVFGDVPILITGVAFVSNADSSFVYPGEASMWHTPRFPERILVSLRDRGPTGSRRSSHRRRSTVFRLERLEERTVLSTLTVLNSLDSGAGSLRVTIAAASPGDTINFVKSVKTITLSTELVINLTPGQAPLDIEGPGPKKLKISGNDASRVFDITGGTVTIAGLTIADGVTDGKTLDSPGLGGGILNLGDLTLSNDIVSNNQALGTTHIDNGFPGGARGGGVHNEGTLTVNACQFLNNLARGADGNSGPVAGVGAGGGIANGRNAESVTVIDSEFDGNVAQGGSGGNNGSFAGLGFGGAIVNSGKLTVTGSTFSHNQAIGGNDNVGPLAAGAGGGGAIGSGNSAGTKPVVLNVDHSIFDHNQAVGGTGNSVPSGAPSPPASLAPNVGDGGAIQIVQGSGLITGCTLDHNSALGGQGATGSAAGNGVGGAMYVGGVLSSVGVTVIDCTVEHNAALGGPGGPGDGDGGDGLGGGFANVSPLRSATLSVSSTIVDHNKARGGDGCGGANGGDGDGGGLYNDSRSTLRLTDTTIDGNLALGGFTLLGTGGDGLGGGLYNDAGSSLVLSSATVKDNFALGGFGLAGFGQGIGGGVYTLVTFSSDSSTVIKKNHASTSNDDIFH
ncbi:MAG: hypothetical protein ABSH35_36330 [Isosphaeraceae bacterium]